MFSIFTHVMNPYETQTGQTVNLGNLCSNKMGKRGFPQHSKETRTLERHRRLSPRSEETKMKGRHAGYKLL